MRDEGLARWRDTFFTIDKPERTHQIVDQRVKAMDKERGR